MARGEIVVQGPKRPGNRVRGAIRKAAPQLKARSCGKLPTMVVVYNNTGMTLHTKPEAVEMGLFGQVEVPILVPLDPNVPPSRGIHRFDSESPAPEDNAAISAVGVLRTALDDTPLLFVYHNPHATSAIDPDAVQVAGRRSLAAPGRKRVEPRSVGRSLIARGRPHFST